MLRKHLSLIVFTSASLLSTIAYTQTEVSPKANGIVISAPQYQGKSFLALSASDNRISLYSKNRTILRGIHLVILERAGAICKVMKNSSAVSYQLAESTKEEELWLIQDDGAQFESVKDNYSWDVGTYPHKTFSSVTCR